MTHLFLTKAQFIYAVDSVRANNAWAAGDFLLTHKIRNFEMHWWHFFWYSKQISILENAYKHIKANP